MAYSDELWAEAKRKCRLNEQHKIVKELNINPRISLNMSKATIPPSCV